MIAPDTVAALYPANVTNVEDAHEVNIHSNSAVIIAHETNDPSHTSYELNILGVDFYRAHNLALTANYVNDEVILFQPAA